MRCPAMFDGWRRKLGVYNVVIATGGCCAMVPLTLALRSNDVDDERAFRAKESVPFVSDELFHLFI